MNRLAHIPIRLASVLSAFLCVPCASLVLPPLQAQTTVESNLPGAGFDTPDATAPTLHVYSRETILDVLVTDDKGRPVRNLKRSDFTILEDGQPRPILSFSEYSHPTPAEPPPALPPNTFSNARTLPANGSVQIFYFDLPAATSYPSGSDPVADTTQGQIVVRAKKYIADYCRSMAPGTQVAIFVYRPDYGLRLIQGFTTDGPRAAAAIDNLVVLSMGGGNNFDPIAAADQIAAYVAGVHGRKNLIWIGTPLSIMRDGGISWSHSGPDLTIAHRLMDTYDLFTREQIAIYPLDPAGVHGLGPGALRNEEIAEQTGGSTNNTNDYKGEIAKVVDDTSHYYTLSYIPPRANEDGHYHPITIHIDRPGLHLVYRNGYNDEHPAPPDNVLKVHMDQATMGLGALPATQLLFELKVQPAQPTLNPAATSGRRLLPGPKSAAPYDLIFKLDPTQLAFLQDADGLRRTSLEFDIAAYDLYGNPDGKPAVMRSQTFNLALTPDEYAEFVQTPFQFDLPVDLPPGTLTLRAGIFETIFGNVGTLEVPLTLANKPAPVSAQAAKPATSSP
jgi:VWFA-related protein